MAFAKHGIFNHFSNFKHFKLYRVSTLQRQFATREFAFNFHHQSRFIIIANQYPHQQFGLTNCTDTTGRRYLSVFSPKVDETKPEPIRLSYKATKSHTNGKGSGFSDRTTRNSNFESRFMRVVLWGTGGLIFLRTLFMVKFEDFNFWSATPGKK
eukprot:196602_1